MDRPHYPAAGTASFHNFYEVWTSEGLLIHKAFAQGREANAVMGGAGFLLSMLMWIACVDAIRRRAYTIFKVLHHVGFYGFVVLGCCHYWRMFWWCLPGLTLNMLEGAMRLLQTAAVKNNMRILHAAVAGDKQMVTLVVAAPDYAVASSGIYLRQMLSAAGQLGIHLTILQCRGRPVHHFKLTANPFPASIQQQMPGVVPLRHKPQC
jgi:hypothetical protein